VPRRYFSFARDYYDVLRSGVFAHSSYSRLHFNSAALAWLSLAHYLLVGERLGRRPNPFFDPAFFRRRAKGARFVDYLRSPALWVHPTSALFDSSWYVEKYSSAIRTTENPLQHFWRIGFDKGFRPSPRFDTEFFIRAIARDQYDPRDYAYDYCCAASTDMPLNVRELEKKQADFYQSIALETLRRIDLPQRRFLVFVQAGDNFGKTIKESVSYDTLVNYYDASTELGGAHYVFRQRGTKTTAVRKLLEECPEILLGYEAVLFLDDDIVISSAQIDSLFAAFDAHKLDLLQASVSEDSECYFPILKQPEAGQGLRPLSGVEIMMPLVSQRALRECGWVFREGISGWGVDILLSAEVRRRYGNRAIALLADVVAVHARATDTSNNMFYKFLRERGIDPRVETGKIAMKFNLNDKISRIHFLSPEDYDEPEAAQSSGALQH
jgi:hypothetical protein